MADLNINSSECGYEIYYYTMTNKQKIPIFILTVPYTRQYIVDTLGTDGTISFDNTTDNTFGSLGFSINTVVPYWALGDDASSSKYWFLEVYQDDYFFITRNSEYNALTGSFRDTDGETAIISFFVRIWDKNTLGGVCLYGIKTTDDYYLMRLGDTTSTFQGEASQSISSPLENTRKGTVYLAQLISAFSNEHFSEQTQFYNILNKSRKIDDDDPNSNSGDSDGDGGGGPDDIEGNTHTGGTTPTISPLDSGLMTLYNPNVNDLQKLGKFLWSDSFDVTAFKKLFNDPFDTLLGLSIVPVSPKISGTHNIIFGNLDTGISTNIVASPWVDIDCGDLTLNEVWKGALDYSPYTQVSIYLPFIGVKQLNTNDVMGSTLNLKYRFDVLTGSCIAEIAINHTSQGNKRNGFSYNANMGTVYTFSGQCSVNIPLASLDYTNTIRAAIEAVGFTAGAAASFAAGHPALGIASLAVGTANAEIKQSTPVVERSGSLGLSSSFMASLEPCLIVSRSHICKPTKYYSLRGVPSQVYVSSLLKASGFIQIADTNNLKVSGANETELEEIKTLLTQGVYVKTWRTKKEQETLEAYSDLDIQLYNNKSAKNQIDKKLSGIRSGDDKLSGTFRDSCDIDNPVVQLRINDVSDLDKCNYMYIGKFNRYYYVTKIVSMRNHIVELSGHVDVLMTYQYYIGQNEAILARSSQVGSGKYGNTYLDDSLMASYNDTYNVCYNWGYSFNHKNDSLILAVAGALQS